MGIFRKLFGSSSKGKSCSETTQVRRIKEGSKEQPKKELSRNASPKETVQHVYQQLKQGVPPVELQTDLEGRGFAADVVDSYIDMVLKTMFKGKGTKK